MIRPSSGERRDLMLTKLGRHNLSNDMTRFQLRSCVTDIAVFRRNKYEDSGDTADRPLGNSRF
jgi:hypothetical protein